ncbi:hypothetical protein JG687_00016586 [Phytophthora cactorum]|uniref:Uncharacterized protein n=1 Tax=Phytophthora cactorum TaxID=29920 RepID=A0A329REQ6_9STRA|nr:hypothetical protein Pcac1_g22668 [Phytophthora cactorum]KAG2796808.1 hypothetical protein PC111_g21559 [Phytophthora cactorum]KAG2825868.1 hypothetical protein PC113_g21856 [Phytophthora cactorum]KAG2876207.1 hypothetical protein PC114_g24323 [Phytophthora cactorum]KAG2883125.1 hypothetical protein PC115_g21723 [Phytophthora cactorum]
MNAAVTKRHAHPNTVFYCLYGNHYLGYTKMELARIYSKTEKPIAIWVQLYEETEIFQQAKTLADKKFTKDHRRWLYAFYQLNPLAYLDEAQDAFN